ncbi:MAG: hypothetical protein J6P29_06415 [Acetobacter sp.]|nr:hypothetical protein [Acetobacter sp.]
MSISTQITIFLGALALVWPFIGALLVAVVSVDRSRLWALWVAVFGCFLTCLAFMCPTSERSVSGNIIAMWQDDSVQRAGRVLLSFGLLLTVLENPPLLNRGIRSLPHVSTALSGVACVAQDPVMGVGILVIELAWGVGVFAWRAGQALAGWNLMRTRLVGVFLVFCSLTLPKGTFVTGLTLACGVVALAGLAPFGRSESEEKKQMFLLLPLATATLLLAMRLRVFGGEAFSLTLVTAGIISVGITSCVGWRTEPHLLRTFPLALGFIAVGVQADVAALLFLSGWCCASGALFDDGRDQGHDREWAVRALACFPPNAPFVGCLLLLSIVPDWSWSIATLSVVGLLLVVMQGVSDQKSILLTWPEEAAGKLACFLLMAMSFLVPLAMMLGAF